MREYLRSWWGWTLVTLFVLIVGTAAWIRLDVAPPEDADLLVPRREVPAETNGFVMLGLAEGDDVVRDPQLFDSEDFDAGGEGESPDFGAHEFGAQPIHYGPRPKLK